MALVLIEGFDHMTSSQVTAKGWSQAFSSMQAGRFDGQCARQAGGSTARTKALPSNYSTLFLGFACRFGTTVGVSGNNIAVIRAGATSTLQLQFDTNGHLTVKNSSNTVIATGTTVLGATAWNYVEIKLVVNGASGSIELHLNGATEIASIAGNFGSTNVDSIGFAGPSASNANDTDDLYVADTTGTTNNTFLGDLHVETIFPNGAGSHTQWTPLSGANYTNVDETTPDDDASYNYDSVVGDIDSFPTAGVDAASTVFGVQTNLYARKDDAGTRQISDLIRQSSTDYVGATDTLASNYLFYSNLYNQDPTSSNWTAAHVNADEFGYKLIA